MFLRLTQLPHIIFETCNDINLYSQLSIDDATGIWDGPSNLSGGF